MAAMARAPARSAGPSPPRRAGSIRRTSTIDTIWPDGRGHPMQMSGRARDLVTPADGSAPIVTAEDSITVLVSPMREILRIASVPSRPRLEELVGQRAGGNLRAAIEVSLPDERTAGSPLYLLVDDLAGASLVAGWAWSRWVDDWMVPPGQDAAPPAPAGSRRVAGRSMEGVCIGFAPGSTALAADGASSLQSSAPVIALQHPDDPSGWHRIDQQPGVGMRRARRIDVWRDDGLFRIDAGFQDSATSPAGERIAVHEYTLTASVDVASRTLRDVQATPRVLPYAECPGAAANMGLLSGQDLLTLRHSVLRILGGVAGCTHLNDALRALAEIPQMVAALDRFAAAPIGPSAPHV